jgi:Na+-driven multidrug efflux pump
MKKLFYRMLTILWFIPALILFISYLGPSIIIWIFTGESYIETVNNFLCGISDKLYHKGKNKMMEEHNEKN